MRKLLDLLLRPFVSAVLASVLTATLIAPREVPIVTRTVVERTVAIPGATKTVTIVRNVCPTAVIERLLNEVIASRARSGDAATNNDADTTAHGDVATSQSGNARSGDAIVGQAISALAVCGSVTINANNHVENSKAETGDAEVENDADTDVGISFTPRPTRTRRTPRPSPSTSPSPVPSSEGLTN